MEAVFAKIAEETSKFELGDEEVCEISSQATVTDILIFENNYSNRNGANYTTLSIQSRRPMSLSSAISDTDLSKETC
jgi:hypothetical protein